MKIALCLENFNPVRGGAERYVSDLAYLLCREGHQVHIHTLSSSVGAGNNLFIHIVKVPVRPKWLRTLSFALAVQRQVRNGCYDVIHSFGRTLGMHVFQPLGGSQMASLVGNLRSINNPNAKALRTLGYFISLRRISYFIVEKAQMRAARLVIAISPMVKSDLIRYNRVEPSKVRIVRNGVDLEKFHPRNIQRYRESIRRDLKVGEKEILILFVAHNFRLKGLLPLIIALARLQSLQPEISYRLAVLGEGKESHFAALARRHGVGGKVIFLGSREDTPRYYAAADFCVHPSFYDPSALVVLEAMASGLPVITTTFCGTSEIISQGKEGFVVDNPREIDTLAETIGRLAEPNRRREMGEAARRHAEQFPYRRNMQEILEIYHECFGNRSRPAGAELPVPGPAVPGTA
ncbi:MAG: glycosyltransferase family 4 protein [Candidatus Aureabacteria bacterium]|nr:glycosyltransferase family 4 protein [Candidatus Auribacterota bacterium]